MAKKILATVHFDLYLKIESFDDYPTQPDRLANLTKFHRFSQLPLRFCLPYYCYILTSNGWLQGQTYRFWSLKSMVLLNFEKNNCYKRSYFMENEKFWLSKVKLDLFDLNSSPFFCEFAVQQHGQRSFLIRSLCGWNFGIFFG